MFLKYGFNLVGLFFSFYVFYCCSARFLKIRDLPLNIISKKDKEKYLGILQKYVLFTAIAAFINLVTFLSPMLEMRLLIALITIFLSTFIYSILLDEIADFDISKSDSTIVQEFLTNRKNISEENKKENKIKKIDVDALDSLEELNGSEDTKRIEELEEEQEIKEE